jgi:hypothetical protein
MDSIPQWRREIAKIVFMFDKELPTSFMDLQSHFLIHLPDEVKLSRLLSSHLMFFLEKYMKNLKGFLRQREKPEGSMANGYILYESFYYSSEYIKQIGDITWVVA